MRYSDNSDMMTWTEAKLKSLDSYLTDKKYAYCETNPCLYTVDGKTPSYNPGGKCLYVDGTQMSMSKYQLIHFIKNRKVIAIDKAKDLYFEKIKSLISKPAKKEKVDFDKQFNEFLTVINDTRKFPELIEAMKNCSNSYKDDTVEYNKLITVIKANYFIKSSKVLGVYFKNTASEDDGLHILTSWGGKREKFSIKGFDIAKNHKLVSELSKLLNTSLDVVTQHFSAVNNDTGEYITFGDSIVEIENRKEVK